MVTGDQQAVGGMVVECVDMRYTYYAIVLRYKGWSISFERDRDRYQLIDLVRDANQFLSQQPVHSKPKFFGLSSHSPQKVRSKWAINTDDDLLKVFDMWKGRKRIEFTILERKFPTLIDKFVLQLARQMGQMIQEGDTEHPSTGQGSQAVTNT
ncbi:hypothetical protein Cgig2_013641 [Carnegiea gigantea]|uniref:Uncharacterized protein n=1 Tax=Carnegiea gigantea TaxID=171969 RepID=A0A9Q1KC19_9CARY|nr:hypothetical protein Cgig2_013641 [Carnegiea gigantea]